MIWRLLGIAALIALLAFWALNSRPSRTDTAAAAQGPGDTPGYAATEATVIETGPDGRARYTVRAAEVRQDPRSDVIDLQDVVLNYRDTRGDRWVLRSREGRLLDKSTRVELQGAVRVTGNLSNVEGAARISTEQLSFDTGTEIVSSRVPVTLTWSGHRLQAVGMRANLKDQQLRLESAVQGRFAP